ncbi:zinc finger CCCH domain-containing protein 3 isoform X1 [Silene latifolia]|uniref:zinc finger CCCH domain-containing protein 3 isoform X1 n=1 Tax=Silene latifolia TaxID=37657 RepID=UPI003D77040F
MTVGKYYCDYCDKEFQDTAAARKRHLQGSVHLRNHKLWYDSLSLPSEPPNQLNVAATSSGNGVCNRFVKTGFCPYGDSCKYHHPMHNLQGSIIQGASGIAGSLQHSQGDSLQVCHNIAGHVVPQSFGMSLGNLPPSLMPPPEGGYQSLPFVDWG